MLVEWFGWRAIFLWPEGQSAGEFLYTFLLALESLHSQLAKSLIKVKKVADHVKMLHSILDGVSHSIYVGSLERLYAVYNFYCFRRSIPSKFHPLFCCKIETAQVVIFFRWSATKAVCVGTAAICSYEKVSYAGVDTPNGTTMSPMYNPVSIGCWCFGNGGWITGFHKYKFEIKPISSKYVAIVNESVSNQASNKK